MGLVLSLVYLVALSSPACCSREGIGNILTDVRKQMSRLEQTTFIVLPSGADITHFIWT